MDKKSVVKIEDLYPVGNLQITKAISFLNVPNTDYSTFLKKNPSNYSLGLKLPKGITEVEVDSHALERWNQRVGPIALNEVLTNMFRVAVLINPNRILLMERGLAILDNEIVFSFECKDCVFKVTTFFGRISLKPLLSNVDILRKYNLRYQEEIDLVIESTVINQQVLPAAPSSVIEFIDDKNRPNLLFYFQGLDNHGGKRNFYYHLIRNTEIVDIKGKNDLNNEQTEDLDKWLVKQIDISYPNRFNLTETQLHVLGLLGNNKFLLNYMSQSDPERLNNLHDTHSRTAIRRFAGNKGWNFLQKNKK